MESSRDPSEAIARLAEAIHVLQLLLDVHRGAPLVVMRTVLLADIVARLSRAIAQLRGEEDIDAP